MPNNKNSVFYRIKVAYSNVKIETLKGSLTKVSINGLDRALELLLKERFLDDFSPTITADKPSSSRIDCFFLFPDSKNQSFSDCFDKFLERKDSLVTVSSTPASLFSSSSSGVLPDTIQKEVEEDSDEFEDWFKIDVEEQEEAAPPPYMPSPSFT